MDAVSLPSTEDQVRFETRTTMPNHARPTQVGVGSSAFARCVAGPQSLSLGRSAKPVRNTLGMISNLLINTPLQRGDSGGLEFLNRFSGFPRDAETAEAVVEFCGAAHGGICSQDASRRDA